MKSTALFVVLCLTLTFASEIQTNSETFSLLEADASLKSQLSSMQGSSIGSMLMTLAEVHLELGGPVDELTNAIKHIVADIMVKTKKEKSAFLKSSALHTRRANSLKALVNSANEDIGSTTQKLTSVLYPRRHALTKDISLLADNIRNNQKTQVREATQRTNEHTNFLTKQKEHRFALAAVDEAITLVQRLKNPRHSLIEMRSAKNSLHKLSTSLTSDHATIAPLISALLELSRNFSNKKAIQQILDLLQKIRANIVKSLHSFTDSELSSKKAYTARVLQLQKELKGFKKSHMQKSAAQVINNNKIKKDEKFRVRRTSDLAKHRKNFNFENASWQKLVAAHASLVVQFKQERATVVAAIKILKGLHIREYLQKRANRH